MMIVESEVHFYEAGLNGNCLRPGFLPVLETILKSRTELKSRC